MRTALLLAVLAACLFAVSAGPYKINPGCYSTDSVRSYPIKGVQFVDFVKARKRGRDVAQAMYPACTYIGHTPKHACYNSIIPGSLGPPQVLGQYGFIWWANFKCSVLLLPAPGDVTRGRGGAAQLGLGQGPVQMDHLGPLVIGDDGSVSRIANWDKLTEREREVALRRLTARNRERLARLRGEGGEGAGPVSTAAAVQAQAQQQQQAEQHPQQQQQQDRQEGAS
ncbi:hypothetical protein ABPG77_008515 [Micractinium sp. CCAP 211/92]